MAKFFEDTLFRYAPTLETNVPGQWRLARIQVYNWGTINGLYDVPVPRSGLLITGESGAGKSTLLDAIATIMAPDNKVRYNQAAAAGTGGDGARDRLSYIRGAFGRVAGDTPGASRTAFLRPGATISGILLTFCNGKPTEPGSWWTAGRMFALPAGSTQKSDVISKEFSVAGKLDLKELIQKISSTAIGPQLKEILGDRAQFYDNSTALAARMYVALGIGGPVALSLLHKTVATKNVTNLDTLMRDYLLDTPQTFALADRLISEFATLNAAHDEVMTAAQQTAQLAPLVELQAAHDEAAARLQQARSDAAALDAWAQTLEQGFALQRQEQAEQELAAAEAQRSHLLAKIDELEKQKTQLEAQKAQLGGVAMARLEGEKTQALAVLASRKKQVATQQAIFSLLECAAPETAAQFAEITAAAGQELKALAQKRQQTQEQLIAAGAQNRADQQQLTQLSAELTQARSEQSALPARNLEIRARLAAALDVAPETFPYVAELITVTDKKWRGAIERLLHNYGLTLLVPAEYAVQVAKWVSQTRLTDKRGVGMKLVYEKISAPPAPLPEPQEQSVLTKLEVAAAKNSAAAAYVWQQLLRRFDVVCVSDAAQLSNFAHAMTITGLIRRGGRHEKDDRTSLEQQSSWILGTDNVARLESLAAQRTKLATRIQNRELKEDELAAALDDLDQLRLQLELFLTVEWEDLDVPGAKRPVEQLNEQLKALENPESSMGHALAQLEEVISLLAQRRSELATLERKVGAAEQQLSAVAAELAAHQPAQDLSEAQLQHLSQVVCGTTTPDPAAYPEQLRQAKRKLTKTADAASAEVTQTEQAMLAIQHGFLLQWPEHTAHLAATAASRPDFLVRLRQLQEDNLPRFKDRFRDLLVKETQYNAAELASEIKDNLQQIRMLLRPINDSLAKTPFDSDRQQVLELKVVDNKTPAVRQFLADLTQLTSNQEQLGTASDEEVEARFQQIAAVLTQIEDAAATASLRAELLDTRRQVKFKALVKDASGQVVDEYDGAKGRSGGQGQKLVTFCLAAALRHQLTDDANEFVPNFGMVVLDEAFDKTDPAFTRDSLEVFKTFGFQLILATPLKMIQAFEPYVGGVVEAILAPDHTTVFSSARLLAADADTSTEEDPHLSCAGELTPSNAPVAEQPAAEQLSLALETSTTVPRQAPEPAAPYEFDD